MADTLTRQNPNIGVHAVRDVLNDAAVEAFALERPGVAWDWMRQTGQAPTGADWVRPQVSDAWARCIDDYNLPAGCDLSPKVVSSAPPRKVEPSQQNSREAFFAGLPTMVYNLRHFLDESNITLLLSDCSGKVIHLLDAGLGVSAGGHNLVRIGVDWGESSIGNNGIGTSILSKEPVAFEGKEHFAKALHPFATAGCPIFSPSGEVSAIVGMITDRRETAKLML
jgi:transcriptional regulator of acetoin/glycerol metabolism